MHTKNSKSQVDIINLAAKISKGYSTREINSSKSILRNIVSSEPAVLKQSINKEFQQKNISMPQINQSQFVKKIQHQQQQQYSSISKQQILKFDHQKIRSLQYTPLTESKKLDDNRSMTSQYYATKPYQAHRSYSEIKSLIQQTNPSSHKFSQVPNQNLSNSDTLQTVDQDILLQNQEKFFLKIAQLSNLQGPEVLKNLGFLIVLLKIIANDFKDGIQSSTQENLLSNIYLKFLNASQYIFLLVEDLKVQEKKAKEQEKTNQIQVQSCQDQIMSLKNSQLNMASQAIKVNDSSRQKSYITENIQVKLENQKLSCELKLLIEKMKKLDVNPNISTIKEEINNNKNEFESQMIELSIKYNKSQKTIQLIQLTCNNLKNQKSKLETELQYLRTSFDGVDGNLKIFEGENYILNAEVIYFRERMGMQVEDFIGLEQRGIQDREHISLMKKKIKTLQQKIERTQIERSTNISIPENPSYKDELDMFTSIRSVFKFNNIFYKKIRASMKGFKQDTIEYNQKKLIEEKLKIRLDPGQRVPKNSDETQDDTFDINKFSYMKPSFFSLISYRLLQYTQGQPELHQSSDISCFFIGQVRGILDSKCNEQQLCESVKEISHFPEFTYGWLGKFQLDKINRKIILQSQDHGDDVRVKFYLSLANPTLNKLWEIVTFREFLLDRSSNDEIYFYLFYRNIIYQGPQLQLHTSTFQAIQYVPWARVDLLISQAMQKYDQEQISQMKVNLKDRCVKKNTNLVIDGSLVLRHLLEFYRQERLVRFKLIQDLFYSCSSKNIDGKPQFDFESFKHIFMNNFPLSLELEKAELYRDCFSAGRGVVTPEVFFTVATESNFFIKQLNLKGTIYNNKKKETLQEIETKEKIVKEADHFIREQVNFLESFKEIVTNYGMESLVYEIDNQYTSLKNCLKVENRDNSKTLQIILISAQRIQKIAFHCVHTNIQRFDIDYQHMLLRNVTADIERLFQDPITQIIGKNATDKSDYEVQIAKVQKIVKNRIQKWYGLINMDLLEKLIQAKIKQVQ